MTIQELATTSMLCAGCGRRGGIAVVQSKEPDRGEVRCPSCGHTWVAVVPMVDAGPCLELARPPESRW